MKITHLGHSTVLVETDQRILVDPGNFSSEWHGITDLDAIIVTHQHPDHFDPQNAPDLIKANPQARLLVEPSVKDVYGLESAEPFHADAAIQLGTTTISAVGGLHQVIYKEIPRVGNVGFVIEAEGEPRFFHPGDSLAVAPAGIDIVGVPAYGPWAAMKEVIDWGREVAAPIGFLIHDRLLSDNGWALSYKQIGNFIPTELTDLRGRGAVEF
ncbi:MAG: MBL fold metallo-hydrolase [Propionibacteriaceae bacterium]|jgi:L-ascorbate metabolism protein UlaG (beta-lactamase superfamily)|nr:MBL fold metallo-hydrolase [Propionibacteriaceae bacterium]